MWILDNDTRQCFRVEPAGVAYKYSIWDVLLKFFN
jgi:hypothetical protein